MKSDAAGTDGAASALAAMLRRHDRERFLMTLFAPSDRRAALWALLAFNLEISRVRETVSQPLIGQIRLQWWRDVLDEAYGDRPVRRHPVATELGAAIRRHSLERTHLDGLVDARERDLDEAPFATPDEVEAYAEATSATLLRALLDALGVADPAALDAARHIGIAWALVGLARAIPFHRSRGWRTVTSCLLEADGRTNEPAPLARLLAERAWWHIARAKAIKAGRAARPVMALRRLAEFRLRQLAAAAYEPGAVSVQSPDPLAIFRLGWGNFF